jgi:predicted metal-dependent hydrolase
MVVYIMKKSSDAPRNLPLFGERFEFRENGSLMVDFDAKVIELNSSNPDHIRRLERILKRKLLQELEPAVEEYSRKLGVKSNRITIRKQRTRWGSCSSNGNLSFNLLLICLPRELIRYVAWHEVTHMKEKHHGRAFKELVGLEFGNYREMEKRLAEYWSSVQNTNFLITLCKA